MQQHMMITAKPFVNAFLFVHLQYTHNSFNSNTEMIFRENNTFGLQTYFILLRMNNLKLKPPHFFYDEMHNKLSIPMTYVAHKVYLSWYYGWTP